MIKITIDSTYEAVFLYKHQSMFFYTGKIMSLKKICIFFSILLLFLALFYFFYPRQQVFNLVLITIDTLRADRLGCYGWDKASTPNIDALSQEGILFERAYSHSPLTLPSHASLLTGSSPAFHGIKDNSFFRLPSNIPTLATLLQKRGYQTGAVVSGATLARSKGLDQGFSEYDDVPEQEEGYLVDSQHIGERIAEKSIESSQKQLMRFWDRPNRPFFLWVHLFDPHAEYRPPSPFQERFPGSPYDGEIAYTDHYVGVLLNFLKQHGKKHNTLVVLTADHGEGLGEHGEASHGYFLYNTTLHIPLILSMQGRLAKGQRYPVPVRSMDVFPTVLSLLNIEEKGMSQGTDLSPYLFQKDWKKQDIILPSYAETYFPHHSFGWRVLKSLTKGRYKYIDTRKGEMYDLQEDPGETRNLLEEENLSAELLALASELKHELQLHKYTFSQGSRSQETQEHLQKLESLSYIGFPSTDSSNAIESKGPDPTERRSVIAMFVQVQSLMAAKNNLGALSLLEKILELDPGNITSWALSGKLYALEENLDKALFCYQKFLELRPDLLSAQKAIVDILIQQGKYEQAEKRLENLLGNNTAEDATLLSRLAYLKLRKQEWDQAELWAKKAILYDSSLPGSWFYLAMARKSIGKTSQAIQDFEHALRLKPIWTEACYHYAVCLIKEGYTTQARQVLQTSLQQAQDPWKEKIQEALEQLQEKKG